MALLDDNGKNRHMGINRNYACLFASSSQTNEEDDQISQSPPRRKRTSSTQTAPSQSSPSTIPPNNTDSSSSSSSNLRSQTEIQNFSEDLGEFNPSKKMPMKRKVNVGNPQLKVLKEQYSVTAILKELAAIQQQGPQKYCILGTRHCSFLHQQIIELL